jgi:hypothetical protein
VTQSRRLSASVFFWRKKIVQEHSFGVTIFTLGFRLFFYPAANKLLTKKGKGPGAQRLCAKGERDVAPNRRPP